MLQKIAKMLIPILAFTSLIVVASQPVSAAYQTKYVENGLSWVDYSTNNNGSIAYPYLTINEALSDMDTDGGIIYVAQGTYTEDLNLINLDNITIAGGYNKGPGDYSVQDTDGQQTIVMGEVTGTNITGTLTGLSFGGVSGINSIIDINLAGGGYSFSVEDCRFALASVLNYFVKISAGSGSSGNISDNVFALVSSDQSVVETAGGNGTVVKNNEFNSAQSTAGTYGIIRATDGAKVTNNLIQNSGINNRVAIRVSDAAEVYNNTIVGGTALTAAIATSGTEEHNVYNNLVVDITGGNFTWAVASDHSNNFTDLDCDPAFTGGSGADAYKLGSTSTCVDIGTTVSSVTHDFFGTSRPSGGGYDVGFHEFYVAQACGNSFVEGAEQCDDGNLTNGDGCDSSCHTEIPPTPGICGDGTLDSGEECDDGNSTNGDGCSATCEDEVVVACGSWLDINSTDSHYAIAVYLCDHGSIVQGDSFGNLRIDDDLTRAELLAMAFRAREYKGYGVVDVNAEACFNDVIDDWYAKYFCTAKDEGFVEGYAGNVAKPGNTVLLGEGLKMFLGALDKVYTIDTDDCWYCSMVTSAGNLDWIPFEFDDPTEVGPMELSRRYAMDMLYRILTN
ncbi:DUF4215 domain-containing protein [Patescibacteria group bacterium]